MSPRHQGTRSAAVNSVPGALKGHERCTVSDPGSRSDHDSRYPCTQCGQLCGQLGTTRGQAGCPTIHPQFRATVPTAPHQLSTSAPRSLACRNAAASTPSTLLTTAVVVISSRTLLFTSVGDERLGLGGSNRQHPAIDAEHHRMASLRRRDAAGPIRGAWADPGYRQGQVWPYGGTPRGTTPRTPVGVPVDPANRCARNSLLVSARP